MVHKIVIDFLKVFPVGIVFNIEISNPQFYQVSSSETPIRKTHILNIEFYSTVVHTNTSHIFQTLDYGKCIGTFCSGRIILPFRYTGSSIRGEGSRITFFDE